MARSVTGQVVPDKDGKPSLLSLNEQIRKLWQAINSLQGNNGQVTTLTGQTVDGDLQVKGSVAIGGNIYPGHLNIFLPSAELDPASLVDPISQSVGQACSELHIMGAGSMTAFDLNKRLSTGETPLEPVDPIATIGFVREDSPNATADRFPFEPVLSMPHSQLYNPIGKISFKPTRGVPYGNLSGATELTLGYPGLYSPYGDRLGDATSPSQQCKVVFNEQRDWYRSQVTDRGGDEGVVHIYNRNLYGNATPNNDRTLTLSGTINAVPSWIGFRQSSNIAGLGKYLWDAYWPKGAITDGNGYFYFSGESDFLVYPAGFDPPFGDLVFVEPGIYRVHCWLHNVSGITPSTVRMVFSLEESATPTTWNLHQIILQTGCSGTLDSIVTIRDQDIVTAVAAGGNGPLVYIETIGGIAQRYGHATIEYTGVTIEKLGGCWDDPLR